MLALGAISIIGCGGGHGHAAPPNCLQAQPCGGDLVGTWSFLGTCSNLPAENQQLQASCPGASLSSVSGTLTGLLAFNADGTFTATNWHEAFGGRETLPLTCAGGSTCAERNGTTTDSTEGVTVTTTTSCTGTSTCVCRLSGMLSVTTGSGTYSTSSAVLSLTGLPVASTFSYCVEENRLHLMQVATIVSTNPPSETATILSDIVAERQ
jgi:hypothetical protein